MSPKVFTGRFLNKENGGHTWITDLDSGRETHLPNFKCPHCQKIGVINQDDGGWCLKCGGYICNKESCLANCTPWQRKIEIAERRAALLRAVGVS